MTYSRTIYRARYRDAGRCPQCGAHPALTVNPRTGRFYNRCTDCRKIDSTLACRSAATVAPAPGTFLSPRSR